MQKFFLQFAGLAIAFTLVLATGCITEPEDEGPGTNPLPPIIRFVSEADFLDADAEVSAGDVFKVKLSADIGDRPLQSISIDEDGAKLDVSRFEINAGAITSNNPFLITGDDVNGGTWEISITSDADFNTVRAYEFTVTDEDGLTDAVSLTITTKGIPVDQTINGVLLNQAGPVGTGGLDLDDGSGTGSSDAVSEIRDLGIDCTIDPANAENWRAQIGTINGAEMVKVDLTVVEGFDFDAVDTKEAITGAFDSGIALADGVSQNVSCTETAVTDVSDPVVVGDMFIVFANDTYYLLRVDEVNAVDGSNGDNIVFSIKY